MGAIQKQSHVWLVYSTALLFFRRGVVDLRIQGRMHILSRKIDNHNKAATGVLLRANDRSRQGYTNHPETFSGVSSIIFP